MQKTQELLLILSNEERDQAEDFIQRRLKLLDGDQVDALKDMVGVGREVLEEVRQRSLRIDSSSRTGKMLSRIYGGAMEGFSQLIRDCNLALSRKEREMPDPEIEDSGAHTKQSTEALQIDIEPDDEEYAWSVIESALAEMSTAEIRELRDSCEEILGWWQTEGGMHESLHVNQWGDINTANGRMAIRKAREEFQAEEIGPFRGFFQNVNLIYQKKNLKHSAFYDRSDSERKRASANQWKLLGSAN